MDQFEKEGFIKEPHIIDLRQANKFGCFMMIPAFLFYAVPYFVIWSPRFSIDFFLGIGGNWDLHPLLYGVMIILITVGGIVVHELIHGICWAIYAKEGWHSIKFGVLKEHQTPYCHCKEPLRVKHYIIGAVMPLVLLGIIPGVISWFNGSWLLLLFGFFFTISAIGDIMVINLIRKLDTNAYVQDHPNEAGYYVYTKISP